MARRGTPRGGRRTRSPGGSVLIKAGGLLAAAGVLFGLGIGLGAWVAQPAHSPVAAAAAGVPAAAREPAAREPAAPVRTEIAPAVPLPRAAPPQLAPQLAALPPQEQAPPPVLAPPPAIAPPPAVAPPPAAGLPAWKRYAGRAEPANGRPMIAIVLDDIGIDKRRSRRAIELPAAVTLAFLPYASELAEQTAQARQRGHELLVHLPMQPHGPSPDPGPNVLAVDLEAEQIRGRVEWSLQQFQGFVGINNHMGSRFTESPDGMRLVAEAMRRHGLLFLDSLTSGRSVGEATMHEQGVPATRRDVFLDNVDTAAEVELRLAQAERVARDTGSAVAIGHPRDATLNVLEAWIPRARAAGFVLVPLTAVIEARAAATIRQAGRQ